jgi:hypothetical protein
VRLRRNCLPVPRDALRRRAACRIWLRRAVADATAPQANNLGRFGLPYAVHFPEFAATDRFAPGALKSPGQCDDTVLWK